ncbi:sterol desaturase family protein [Rhodoferax sp.]|uniref:sterol desaturase family protein n=1 Tax=Rhodoferax sp. TaxID=50421 RepID=UPI0028506C7A|nr:sterol desaturase family protein [Rhodoferax sp.]MDR3368140.1 sterol desaturase family protein [Rhodoferax sp.]
MIDFFFLTANLLVGEAQTWLFVNLVQPVLFHFHLMVDDDFAYDGLLWFLAGVLQIAAVYAVLRPLEAWRPIERWSSRKALRVDVIYTLINRLGLISLLLFFTLQPMYDSLQEWLRLRDIDNLNLESLWPGISDRPLVSFLLYLVVFDFAGYWYHRWQHQIQWWWELHAVHHSQRQLSLWADDRNHLLDNLLQAAWFASLALIIGVPPGQFVALSLVSGALQSLQHANVRVPFGWLGERLLVSPRFHRVHHAIGYGHELGHHNNARLYGCNFGILFPWWDMFFRSADFDTPVQPTGVRAQLPPPEGQGEDYGDGFWAQQWLGIVRMARHLPDLRPASHKRAV